MYLLHYKKVFLRTIGIVLSGQKNPSVHIVKKGYSREYPFHLRNVY